jgi:hypothetical protein
MLINEELGLLKLYILYIVFCVVGLAPFYNNIKKNAQDALPTGVVFGDTLGYAALEHILPFQPADRNQREKVQTEERIVNGNAAKEKQAQRFSAIRTFFSSIKCTPIFTKF